MAAHLAGIILAIVALVFSSKPNEPLTAGSVGIMLIVYFTVCSVLVAVTHKGS